MLFPFTPFTSLNHKDFLLEGGHPAALLIHGYPGTPMEMRPLADALHARGWTCRGLLLPGFGRQIETLPQRRWTEWLDAILDSLAILQKDHAPLLLVGHSLGGALAITAAARFPVDGLVLLAPFWRFRIPGWDLLPLAKHIIPRIKPFKLVKTEIDDPRLRKEIKDFLPELDLEDPQNRELIHDLVLPLAMFDELRQAGLACFRSAPGVTCPALVLQGAQDTTVYPGDTRRLVMRLAGPVRQGSVPGAHELVFAASPSFPRVVASVLSFAEDALHRFPDC